jgi:hypothetical protein
LTNQDSGGFSSGTASVNGVVVVSGPNGSKEFGMVASGGSISVTGFGSFYSYAGIKVYKNP